MAGTAMTCEKFEAILPDYFEGDLSDETKAIADAHVKTCESCAKIVADINRLTVDAAALPPMRPARDLWSGIEERISAPVIPLAHPARRSAQPFASRWTLAAAAAILVVTTVGVTYVVTARIAATQPQHLAAVTPTFATPRADSNVSAPSVTPTTEAPSTVAPSRGSTPPATTVPRGTIQNVHTPSATLASNDPSARGTAGVVAPALSPQADAAYAEEIGILPKLISPPNPGLSPQPFPYVSVINAPTATIHTPLTDLPRPLSVSAGPGPSPATQISGLPRPVFETFPRRADPPARPPSSPRTAALPSRESHAPSRRSPSAHLPDRRVPCRRDTGSRWACGSVVTARTPS